MKHLSTIGAKSLGFLMISTLLIGGNVKPASATYPGVTDAPVPGVTDAPVPGITDAPVPGVTDGSPTEPHGHGSHSLIPGNKKEPKKFVKNHKKVSDAKHLAKKLASAHSTCKNGGDCSQFKQLLKEGRATLKQLDQEKRYYQPRHRWSKK